jgi:endonuclease YncB( thermonuclease family)
VPAAVLATGFTAINCCFSAAAEESSQPAFPCAGAIIARGIASRFIDGRTFILDDGREVRFGRDRSTALPLPQEPGTAPGGAAARDALAGLLAGSEVVLRQAEPQKADRHGRVVAYAFTARDGVERSVQARRGAGGKPGVRSGTPEPGKHRAARQAWPLGQFVL